MLYNLQYVRVSPFERRRQRGGVNLHSAPSTGGETEDINERGEGCKCRRRMEMLEFPKAKQNGNFLQDIHHFGELLLHIRYSVSFIRVFLCSLPQLRILSTNYNCT